MRRNVGTSRAKLPGDWCISCKAGPRWDYSLALYSSPTDADPSNLSFYTPILMRGLPTVHWTADNIIIWLRSALSTSTRLPLCSSPKSGPRPRIMRSCTRMRRPPPSRLLWYPRLTQQCCCLRWWSPGILCRLLSHTLRPESWSISRRTSASVLPRRAAVRRN